MAVILVIGLNRRLWEEKNMRGAYK